MIWCGQAILSHSYQYKISYSQTQHTDGNFWINIYLAFLRAVGDGCGTELALSASLCVPFKTVLASPLHRLRFLVQISTENSSYHFVPTLQFFLPSLPSLHTYTFTLGAKANKNVHNWMVEKHRNMQYCSNLDHTRHEKSSKPSATRLSLKTPFKGFKCVFEWTICVI